MVIDNLYQSKQQATSKNNKRPQRTTSDLKANNKRPTSDQKMTKTNMSKYEIYKIIYNDRNVYIEWLDEIKKNGVDNKKRVRNPLREGSLIYTDKNGLYSTLWDLCVVILQGNYNFNGIPQPIKRVYQKQQKFYNKPQ